MIRRSRNGLLFFQRARQFFPSTRGPDKTVFSPIKFACPKSGSGE